MSSAPSLKAAPQARTLPELARESLSAHDGDVASAVNALVVQLQGDVKLLRSVIEAVVRDAVAYRVEHTMRHRRASIIRAATASTRGAVVALANGISAALLDMPLAGGLRLREAGRDDVLAQAARYESQAADMGHKARWLKMIAKVLTPDNTVGDVITEERALQLWQEASR